MNSQSHTPAVRDAAAYVTSWTDRERRLLKDTSRIGVWSLFGATALFLGSAAGLSLPLGIGYGLQWFAVGAGLTVGGLYTAFASGLLLWKLRRGRFGLLKLGGLAGFPFGLAAMSLGFWWLTPRLGFQAASPVGFTLFIVLGMVLLLTLGGGLGKEVSRIFLDEVGETRTGP